MCCTALQPAQIKQIVYLAPYCMSAWAIYIESKLSVYTVLDSALQVHINWPYYYKVSSPIDS